LGQGGSRRRLAAALERADERNVAALRRGLARGHLEAVMRCMTSIAIAMAMALLFLAANAAAAPSAGDPGAMGDDLELAGARVPVHGPSVGAVLTAAYAAAGLDPDPAGSWAP